MNSLKKLLIEIKFRFLSKKSQIFRYREAQLFLAQLKFLKDCLEKHFSSHWFEFNEQQDARLATWYFPVSKFGEKR